MTRIPTYTWRRVLTTSAGLVLLLCGLTRSPSLAFAESPTVSGSPDGINRLGIAVGSSPATALSLPGLLGLASRQGDAVPGMSLHHMRPAAPGAVEELASRYDAVSRAPRPLLAQREFTYFSGQPLTVQFNVALADFSYYLSPPVSARAWVDRVDRRLARIELLEYEQGRTYDLYLVGAVAEKGFQSEEIDHLRVSTPPPLKVVETYPEDGAIGVAPNARPVIAFSEAVADRAAAEEVITADPPTRLIFMWTDDSRVELSPAGGWPFETDITIKVTGGPSSVVGTGGGFMSEPVALRFTTRPNKTIDVDLTKQVVTLYDGDQAVYSSPTATGVRGAETPTGDFTVQYKLEKTRMRGINPSGRRYDIPDVPWVLAFWGDYTIHGAPWRQAFGTPQSNGCVSLPVEAARFVYDWAPVGTLIHIHY